MITLSQESVYLYFCAWVGIAFLLVRSFFPEARRQFDVMGLCGGIGGVTISQLYRRDFWNPPSLFGYTEGPVYLTLEDFLFGYCFLGIVTALMQITAAKKLHPEHLPVSGFFKGVVIVIVIALSLLGSLGSMNSLLATSIGFMVGISILSIERRDLVPYALKGSFFTMTVFVFLISMFLVFVDNRLALAIDLCQYCRNIHVFQFILMLMIWSLSFGAFFSVFYPFMANKAYVKR